MAQASTNPSADLKVFTYVALSMQGERIKGRLKADSESAVRHTLKQKNMIPLNVKVRKVGLSSTSQIYFTGRHLKGQDLAGFTRQLYAMVNAGISLGESLGALLKDTKHPRRREMIIDLIDRLEEGYRLSDAMARWPKSFDDVYLAYIKSGEITGNLTQAMERLATSLEKKQALRRKVVSVMTYPVMVSGVITLIVTGILVFLVPQFQALYDQLGGQLPGPTRLLVKLSNGFLQFWWIAVIVIVGIVLFFRQTKGNLKIGTRLDKLKFRTPVLGNLMHKLVLFRWAETISGALEAGVAPIEAVKLGAVAAGSRWMQTVAPALVNTLRTGKRMTEEMEKQEQLFPTSVQTMVHTGERTGELPEMLGRVAVTLDDEVTNIVDQLSSKLEVTLLVVMGTVVGGLMIALYLPIFNAPSLIK